MTSGELKEQYTMRDVLSRYGLQPDRQGFIHCPFHKGDRDASMKIYERDFHCFGCGAHGDIFTFIQKMENCDFKTAFYSLGGVYEKPTFKSKLSVYRSENAKKMKAKQQDKLAAKKKLNNDLIDIYRDWYLKSEPFSDVWVECYNKLQYQLYLHDYYDEEG